MDLANGVIIDKVTGDRCIIITKDRMSQILSRFTDIFQSSAQVLIAETSKSAGERFIAGVPEEKRADLGKFLVAGVKRFTNAGLGRVEVVKFKLEKREFKFRVRNNFFAEIRPSGESTCCYIVGAFVAGVYRGLFNDDPVVMENQCIAKGASYCEWHVAPESEPDKKRGNVP
ncbi:MAG: hypothetical protein ACE14S_02115 [Candidatus Bathyarchaeia archaeon]